MGIWGNLVVPLITLSSSDGASHGANYTFGAVELRPTLNCTMLP